MAGKLTFFTAKELKRMANKQLQRVKDAYERGYMKGAVQEAQRTEAGYVLQRNQINDILAAAIFEMHARDPGKVEVQYSLHKSLVGAVKLVHMNTDGDTINFQVVVKEMVP